MRIKTMNELPTRIKTMNGLPTRIKTLNGLPTRINTMRLATPFQHTKNIIDRV